MGVALLGVAVWHALDARAPARTVEVPPAAVAAAPAAQAPVAAPVVVKRDLPAILALEGSGTTTDNAFTQLLGLWGATYQPGIGRPCDQVMSQGLQCVADIGTLAQLKLINRPAILSLTDAAGTEHQVVLESLAGDLARIAIGATHHEVSVADLAGHWFGEFLVVWRPSIPMAKQLRQGMRGDDVRWLREALATLEGAPASAANPEYFDGELQRLVEDFQRSRRLAVDGVAGVQTQLVLDSAIGTPGTPTLAGPAGGDA
jgi:general secretion pathway protein A